MWRAAQCRAQNEREETIYCSKVPPTPISASLNVYYQFLAFEPCLAALLITSQLSDSSPLSVLLSFHIVCSHSTLHISSMSSHLSLFLSARHSLPSPGCSVNQRHDQRSLRCCICVLNLSVLFSSSSLCSPYFLHHLSLFMSCSLSSH